MTKRDKIIYWISTIWLALGMVSSGVVQAFRMEEEIEFIINLGFPEYFLVILGVWKLLGVIAVLIPKFPLLKEWAYAGFFFIMSGAIFSHIAMNGSLGELFPPFLLLTLTVISWYFRPNSRRIASIKSQNE